MNLGHNRAAPTISHQYRTPQPGRWQSIPLPVRMMFVMAGALFAMALTMHSVQAQTISSTVCQPTALPLSGAESRAVNSEPTLNHDGTRAAFWSTANPLDTNIDRSIEIFWADTTALTDTSESPIRQATTSRGNILGGFNIMPDMMTYITSGNVQRSFAVFASDRDFESQTVNGVQTPMNRDGGFEIFLAQLEPEQRIWQLTDTSRSASMMPTVSSIIGGRYLRIAYLSDADSIEERPKANNPDRNYEVHTMRVDLLPLDQATPGRPTIDQEYQLTNTSLDTVNDQPVVSANGGKVVWLSNASAGINVVNTLSNPDRNREVFVTTVANPTVGVQVTKSTRGDNDAPDINEDGTRITFASTVSNYPANGVFGTSNLGPQSIYIARLTAAMQANSVTGLSRISAAVGTPTGRTFTAKEPAISSNGRRVVFAADGCDPLPSSNLCSEPGMYQVYVVDQQLSSPTAFSIAQVTHAVTRTHELPAISGDGQRIALVTTQDAGANNPDLSGSEILALECRVARLGASISMTTVSPSLVEDRPDVGDEVSFRIGFENTTFANFTGQMVITNTLPPGLTFISRTLVSKPDSSQVSLGSTVGGVLIWSVTDLESLSEVVVEVRARVNATVGGAPIGGQRLLNVVTLSTDADLEAQGISNFDDSEDFAFRVTQVDLRANLSASPQTPREGQVFTYTVSVHNPQTVPPVNPLQAETMDPATGVVVTTTLNTLLGTGNPMEYVGVSTTGGASAASFNPATGIITIPRINGAPLADATLVHITMRPRSGTGGQPPYAASIIGIRSDQQDIAPVNDIGTASQPIRVLGTDMAIANLSVNPPVPPQNSTVTFRVDIRNRGPLPNTPNPPADALANNVLFQPAMVSVSAQIPTGVNITAISDGGRSTAILTGTEVIWQLVAPPAWTFALTRTVYVTGTVVAEPGADLQTEATIEGAYFDTFGTAPMVDPVPANNRVVTPFGVNSRATIGTPTPTQIAEGGSIDMPVDYGDLDLEDTHFITVTWGDGSPPSTSGWITRPEGEVNGVYTFTHIYADDPAGVGNSTYPIVITLVDSTGNVQTAHPTEIVDNVAPNVSVTGTDGFVVAPLVVPPTMVALAGQPIQVSLAFSDPGFSTPWSDEEFRYIMRSSGPDVTGVITTVTNGEFGTPTTGAVTIQNTYPTPGNGVDIFPVEISVLDDDMNTHPNPIQLFFMVDERPVAIDDEYTLNEGQQVLAEALSQGLDTDNGHTLEVASLDTSATQGIVSGFDPLSGSFVYTASIPNLSSGQVYQDRVGYVVVDSVGLTDTATVFFNVTGVNDAPVVDLNSVEVEGIHNTAAFVEDAPGLTLLAPIGDLFDNDGDDEIQSLSVSLTNPQDGALESLAATVTSTITLLWDPGNYTLTLTKTNPAITPDWTAALRSVRYLNSSTDPNETPRTINFVASDQDGPSVIAVNTLSVTSVDDAPIVTLNAAALAVNEGTAAIVDSGATVTDEDTATWGGGSLTASVVGATALDYLRVAPGGDITIESGVSIRHGVTEVATYTGGGTSQIVITFLPEATTAIVQAVVRQIEYLRGSGVAEGNRSVTMVANSVAGGPNSNVATRALTIAYTNDPPAIGMTPPTVTEDTPLNIRANISVSDPDAGSGNLRMTIAVNQGTLLVEGVGVPVVPATAAASVVFTGTLAQLNSGTITYAPPLNYDGIVNLSVTVNDLGNTGGDPETASVSLPFDITGVNDAPVVDLNGPGATGVGTSFAVTFTEGAGAVTIVDTDATITDIEGDNIVSLTASLGVLDAGSEFLTATVSSGITALYTPATGVLTLTGNRPVADYQAVLLTLRYANTSTNPNITQRTVQVTAQDAPGATSAAAVAQITVIAANNAPVIDLNGPLVAGIDYATTFTEDGGNQTLVASDFTITDPDSPLLQGVRVILQNRPDGTVERLGATAIAPVTVAAYNDTNGQLDLVGPATPAEFRQVIATVVYTNTDDTPNTTARNIDFFVADSQGAISNPVARTVLTVVATNDPPVLDLNGNGAGLNTAATYTEGSAAVAIVGTTGLSGLTITDVDTANIVSATVRITNMQDGVDEQLNATSGGQFTVGYNSGTGVLSITANPVGGVPFAAFQTRLRTVVYQNTSQAPGATPRQVTFVIQDSGGALSEVVTSTVTVVGVNDPPTMTGFAMPTGILEDAGATDISSAITVGDVDAGTGQLRLTLGVQWGALSASGGGVTVAGNGTTSVVMTGTIANLNGATVTFTPTPNQNGANQLTATINDLGNFPAPAQSFSPTAAAFTVTAQNDEPHQIANTGLDQTQALSPTLPITYNITSATLQFGDIDGDPANQIIYTVQTLPTNGALMLGSTALVACAAPGTSTFTQADIDNGLLRYRMTSYTAAFVTSFGFAIGNAANCGGASNSYSISVHP